MQTLNDLVPQDNMVDHSFNATGNSANSFADTVYHKSSPFVGAFIDDEESPTWARRAARLLDDDFIHNTPGVKKYFGDVHSQLINADGKSFPNFRHALEQWEWSGKQGPEPYTLRQLLGSCVDACCAEGEDGLFGIRIAKPELWMPHYPEAERIAEQWRCSAGWYKYTLRGYCSDGWNGDGVAGVGRRIGAAFRMPYSLDGFSIDFTNGPFNEKTCGRTWCRRGIPKEMLAYSQANHMYLDGAITKFQGGVPEIKLALGNGGTIMTAGRRTSGGSTPFKIGSVGPHMQTNCGGDDSEKARAFFSSLGLRYDANDFIVFMHQTWGSGWRGECADKYWAYGTDGAGKVYTMEDVKRLREQGQFNSVLKAELLAGWGWGEKPQGIWVWKASDLLKHLYLSHVWLPWVKGFPAQNPVPPPIDLANLAGQLYVETVGERQVIRGTVVDDLGRRFAAAPSQQSGRYVFHQVIDL